MAWYQADKGGDWRSNTTGFQGLKCDNVYSQCTPLSNFLIQCLKRNSCHVARPQISRNKRTFLHASFLLCYYFDWVYKPDSIFCCPERASYLPKVFWLIRIFLKLSVSNNFNFLPWLTEPCTTVPTELLLLNWISRIYKANTISQIFQQMHFSCTWPQKQEQSSAPYDNCKS